MSLYQDIRGALQAQLAAVSGVPEIAYEGMKYEPTLGTPYVSAVFAPIPAVPATMGSNHLLLHEGAFNLSVNYPSGVGTGAAEQMADTIRASFTVATVLTLNSNDIRIRRCGRRIADHEIDWVRVPIEILWYLYSETY